MAGVWALLSRRTSRRRPQRPRRRSAPPPWPARRTARSSASHPHSPAVQAPSRGADKMFSLKKWNAVAMWSWDVECDTCAICRVQVMGKLSPARGAGAAASGAAARPGLRARPAGPAARPG